MASPSGEANLAGFAADIDRAIARDMEAAGVEDEIGDFSAVFQLFDGARVVVTTC